MRKLIINKRIIFIDIPPIYKIPDRQEEICKLCEDTFFEGVRNGTQHFMCEGGRCEEAEELYMDYKLDEAIEWFNSLSWNETNRLAIKYNYRDNPLDVPENILKIYDSECGK